MRRRFADRACDIARALMVAFRRRSATPYQALADSGRIRVPTTTSKLTAPTVKYSCIVFTSSLPAVCVISSISKSRRDDFAVRGGVSSLRPFRVAREMRVLAISPSSGARRPVVTRHQKIKADINALMLVAQQKHRERT